MFTGLIEEVGRIERLRARENSVEIEIRSSVVVKDARIGDSIAVNGACLTIVRLVKGGFVADAVSETMRRTNLKAKSVGDPVNLERALALGARLGGHLVNGHVDGVGTVARISQDGVAHWLTIQMDGTLGRYMIEKGSVTVDGVSLTIAQVDETSIALAVIPHTWTHTGLSSLRLGDTVNLECDVLAKYVEKLLLGRSDPSSPSHLTFDKLLQAGFI